MRICIVHGYTLSGTGSNLYVANFARELCALGHEVLIMCQEPHPESLDLGNIKVVRPDLGGRLLVYVYDEYEGFHTVKTLKDASGDEIDDFVQRNAAALKGIIDDFGPDWIQTNHAVLQPYIAHMATRESGTPYIAALHGSSLNFSVKKRESLHRYAMEGLNGASAVVAVSDHCARDLEEYLESKGEELKPEIHVVPAGVDTATFKPHYGERTELVGPLRDAVSERLRLMPGGQTGRDKEEFSKAVGSAKPTGDLSEMFRDHARKFDRRHPDGDIIETIDRIDWKRDEIVLFIGKYLWTKGAQVLLMAAPLILKEVPQARFIFTGFGDSKEILMALSQALASGRADLVDFMLQKHAEIDPGSAAPTPPVELMFLEGLRERGLYDSYFGETRDLPLAERIHFTGFLSHGELRYLLPMADAFAAPSIFSEAFGQVAAEAMSCGVYPLVTYASGFKEVARELHTKFDDALPPMPRLLVDEGLVTNLSGCTKALLTSEITARHDFKGSLSGLAGDLYGWKMIAGRYVELAKRL